MDRREFHERASSVSKWTGDPGSLSTLGRVSWSSKGVLHSPDGFPRLFLAPFPMHASLCDEHTPSAFAAPCKEKRTRRESLLGPTDEQGTAKNGDDYLLLALRGCTLRGLANRSSPQ